VQPGAIASPAATCSQSEADLAAPIDATAISIATVAPTPNPDRGNFITVPFGPSPLIGQS
jgi:hypothetical protein